MKGDIEIHIHDENWELHHHHQDPRYNNVILHLSLWIPTSPQQVVTQSNREILRSYLERKLTIPLSRILSLIDLDLYPYRSFVGSGKCAQSLFKELSKEKIETLFHSAAEYRLLEKSEYLIAQADQVSPFMAGVAKVLGYKHNGTVFFELFLWLYKHYPASVEEDLLVISLGICGFFDIAYKKKWGNSSYYKGLHARWEELSSSVSYRASLVLHHIRPLNHPIRRMILLAKMIADPDFELLYSKMSRHWHQAIVSCHKNSDWIRLRQQLMEMLPNYQDVYWNTHYTFEELPKAGYLTLLGENVRQEIIVNIFLPLLYREIYHAQEDLVNLGSVRHSQIETLCSERRSPSLSGKGEEEDRFSKIKASPYSPNLPAYGIDQKTENNEEIKQLFLRFYQTFPMVANSKTKYLTHRFFGNTVKGDAIGSGSIQQGTFQLHRDFCTQYEASCQGCPFVDRYKNIECK